MKYLLIRLKIQDGERQYIYQCTHTTTAKNINFAAERYASTFWGESSKNDKGWDAWGGQIHIKVDKVTELSKEKFEELGTLLS